MRYAICLGVVGALGYHFFGIPGGLLGVVLVLIAIVLAAMMRPAPPPITKYRRQQHVWVNGETRGVYADTKQ